MDEGEFLASLEENSRVICSRILDLAKKKEMCIKWVSGFSLNVVVNGTLVGICWGRLSGLEDNRTLTILTALYGNGSVAKKTKVPQKIIQDLYEKAKATGLFQDAGQELKCCVRRKFTDTEIDSLVAWCESVKKNIREYGLKE